MNNTMRTMTWVLLGMLCWIASAAADTFTRTITVTHDGQPVATLTIKSDAEVTPCALAELPPEVRRIVEAATGDEVTTPEDLAAAGFAFRASEAPATDGVSLQGVISYTGSEAPIQVDLRLLGKPSEVKDLLVPLIVSESGQDEAELADTLRKVNGMMILLDLTANSGADLPESVLALINNILAKNVEGTELEHLGPLKTEEHCHEQEEEAGSEEQSYRVDEQTHLARHAETLERAPEATVSPEEVQRVVRHIANVSTATGRFLDAREQAIEKTLGGETKSGKQVRQTGRHAASGKPGIRQEDKRDGDGEKQDCCRGEDRQDGKEIVMAMVLELVEALKELDHDRIAEIAREVASADEARLFLYAHRLLDGEEHVMSVGKCVCGKVRSVSFGETGDGLERVYESGKSGKSVERKSKSGKTVQRKGKSAKPKRERPQPGDCKGDKRGVDITMPLILELVEALKEKDTDRIAEILNSVDTSDQARLAGYAHRLLDPEEHKMVTVSDEDGKVREISVKEDGEEYERVYENR